MTKRFEGIFSIPSDSYDTPISQKPRLTFHKNYGRIVLFSMKGVKARFMQDEKNSLFEELIKKYFPEILRYCKARFHGDIDSAEECTQEVFLLFLEKKDELDLTDNIRGWLYAAADRIIMHYNRRKAIRSKYEGEDIEKAESFTVESIEEQINSVFDELSEEEYSLLQQYYETDDKSRLALQLGITMNTLFQRIHVIKKKIKRKNTD